MVYEVAVSTIVLVIDIVFISVTKIVSVMYVVVVTAGKSALAAVALHDPVIVTGVADTVISGSVTVLAGSVTVFAESVTVLAGGGTPVVNVRTV